MSLYSLCEALYNLSGLFIVFLGLCIICRGFVESFGASPPPPLPPPPPHGGGGGGPSAGGPPPSWQERLAKGTSVSNFKKSIGFQPGSKVQFVSSLHANWTFYPSNGINCPVFIQFACKLDNFKIKSPEIVQFACKLDTNWTF